MPHQKKKKKCAIKSNHNVWLRVLSPSAALGRRRSAWHRRLVKDRGARGTWVQLPRVGQKLADLESESPCYKQGQH